MTNEETIMLAGMAIGGTMAIIMVIMGIILYVLTCFGYAKMFKKAGEAGWKAYIPIYNWYILFNKCWNIKMFWVTMVVGVISGIVDQLSGDSTILGVLSFICSIVVIVLQAKRCGHVARAYGRKTGTAVGLFFLPTIFSWILGLGSAEYTAPAEA